MHSGTSDDSDGDSELNEEFRQRKKHMELERARRGKMKNQFLELGQLVGIKAQTKKTVKQSVVVEQAILKLKQYNDTIKTMESRISNKKAPSSLSSSPSSSSSSSFSPPSSPECVCSYSTNELEGMRDIITRSLDGKCRVNHSSVFHLSTLAMDIVSADGRILDCNDEFVKLLARDKKTLLGCTVFDITHQDSLPSTMKAMNALVTRYSSSDVKKITRPNGEVVTVQVSAWMIHDRGALQYIMAIVVPVDNNSTETLNLEVS